MANGTWRIARRGNAQLPLLIAALLAALLILAGKAHFVPFERARAAITDKTGPFLAALNAPVVAVSRWFSGIGHFFDVYSENQRLRDENARLLQWRGAALSLQSRITGYEHLLKAVPDSVYSAVTAKVIARSSQPFLETIVLDAGRQNGVRPGQAVADARGMLGRIYVSGQRTSWVILIDDLNSRIPVLIRPGNVEAILAGNNSSEPTLEALPPNVRLKGGSEVVTSGDGGLLPAGLPVGLLRLDRAEVKVTLYADPLGSDEVRILDYKSPIETMPKPSDRDLPPPFNKPAPPPVEQAQSSPEPKPPQAPGVQTTGQDKATQAARVLPNRGPNSVNVIRPTTKDETKAADSSDDQTNQ
jgi:rod shape-determining protein MreC